MATSPVDQPSQADQQRAAEIAVALTAATAVAAAPGVLAVLVPLGIPRVVVLQVLAVVYEQGAHPIVAGFGEAGRVARRQALIHRAAYVLAAARRVDRARRDAGRPTSGDNPREAVAAAVTRERRFYAQQRDAEANRTRTAADVDKAALEYGPLLGWYSVRDERTSPECRAAHGGTFRAGQPPVFGYPGAVHPHCRCRPGPARAGAPSVNAKLAAAGITRRPATAA